MSTTNILDINSCESDSNENVKIGKQVLIRRKLGEEKVLGNKFHEAEGRTVHLDVSCNQEGNLLSPVPAVPVGMLPQPCPAVCCKAPCH